MTTLIRVNPPIVPTTGTISNQYASVGKSEQVTFQPVSDAVLAEIMGLASLGVGELGGIKASTIPAHLYKWHTWLLRMNKWMKDNAKLYPKKMSLKDVRIPAHLYFMGTISPDDTARQVALAHKMPLGPLLPADKNTFINAMHKGSAHCRDANARTLIAFVKDVDKIAIQTMGDRNGSTTVDDFDDLAEDDVLLSSEGNMVIPLPPVVKHNVRNKVVQVVEHFAGKAKGVPIWGWVLILMAIFYFLNRKSAVEDVGIEAIKNLEIPRNWTGSGGGRRNIF